MNKKQESVALNKNYRICFALSILLCSAVVFASPQPAKNGFPAFWSQFKSAVARQDAAAVADLTAFPFDYGKPLDRAAFIRQYRKMFGGLKSCIAKAKPVRDGEAYSIFCGEQGLSFEKSGGAYKFTGFFAND